VTTYAPPFTSRWRGVYRAGGIQHTIQFRGARGATFSTMDGYKDRAREIFDSLIAFLYEDFAWISAEVCLTDVETFTPSTIPGGTSGTIDITERSPRERIRGLTFSGKAPGSRARFTMFGLHFPDSGAGTTGGDGLILPSEVVALAAVIVTANTYFHANSGDLAGWHERATYKENDHLLKLVRRGTIT